ncbi:unnamed protein product [Paramecium octaurelia]|uniref:Ubiquitin-like domain-containing protein n=1 Tax=Paramecium octaurelia TaxID=43137 RepID=A0A8S1WR36_PAROT|nr:unnamed protein product [Paramecium octaurelia]
MNLKIEVLGSKVQFVQLDQNLLVSDAIDALIQKLKLKEQNQQLGLYVNGIELKKNERLIQKFLFSNDIVQLKKIEQIKQLQGIKLRFTNEIRIAYVYQDDLINVLYDQAEKQFSLSKDSFKLTYNDQILQKMNPTKQYQIDATSTVEVKTQNQCFQQKQMIELILQYEKECKNLQFDLYGKIFELEEKAKALFQIKQDICILNDKQILLPDKLLFEVDINKNRCLLIFLKDSYQKNLSFVDIDLEYNEQSFTLSVSTDTLISELIDLLKSQHNLTDIDIMKDQKVLPKDLTINQLNIQKMSRLKVVHKQNNTLKLEIKIENNIEKMEVDNETEIEELISQIQSNFQLKNIELKLSNGQKLVHKKYTLKQYNIQNGTQLLVEFPQLQQIRQSNGADYNQQIRQSNGADYNYNNNTIKVFVLYQQQKYQFQFQNNQLIEDLENKMKEELNCSKQIQLLYQNIILPQKKSFLQAGITDGCVLQCNFPKIKIIEQGKAENPLLRVIIKYESQEREQMLQRNTLLEAVIQSIKQEFSISQEIYLITKERNLDSQKSLEENDIKDNTEIFVKIAILKITIIINGQKMQTLEVTYDTQGEDLQQQIKYYYKIEDDFDLVINEINEKKGIKINPKQSLKDQGIKNGQTVEVQIKKGQGKQFQEQKNNSIQQNQQFQQQSQSKVDHKIQSNQYTDQQNQQNQQPQQNQKFPKSKILVNNIEDMRSEDKKGENINNNSNFKQKQVNIKFQTNNLKKSFELNIELSYETTISEIIEYIINNYQINDKIKLSFKGRILEQNQNLANIQIKDNETIYVEPNNVP